MSMHGLSFICVVQMRQLSVRKLSRHGPSTASSPGADGDNVSVASGFSTFNEDAGLQEAYIGFVRKLHCTYVST